MRVPRADTVTASPRQDVQDVSVRERVDSAVDLHETASKRQKRLITSAYEWPGWDSNPRATDYESAALTTELPGRRDRT